MATKPQKKTRNRTPSLKQAKAIQYHLEHGGSVAEAMRHADYSPKTVKNPMTLTKSRAYIQVLEKAGLTDTFLSQQHLALINSARLDRIPFPGEVFERLKKVGKGKKAVWKTMKRVVFIDDEEIKKVIEAVPGHLLAFIHRTRYEKVAYVQVPDNVVRKGGIEMAYKVKGHNAPEQHELIDHELTEEEQKKLDTIFGKNKK